MSVSKSFWNFKMYFENDISSSCSFPLKAKRARYSFDNFLIASKQVKLLLEPRVEPNVSFVDDEIIFASLDLDVEDDASQRVKSPLTVVSVSSENIFCSTQQVKASLCEGGPLKLCKGPKQAGVEDQVGEKTSRPQLSGARHSVDQRVGTGHLIKNVFVFSKVVQQKVIYSLQVCVSQIFILNHARWQGHVVNNYAERCIRAVRVGCVVHF